MHPLPASGDNSSQCYQSFPAFTRLLLLDKGFPSISLSASPEAALCCFCKPTGPELSLLIGSLFVLLTACDKSRKPLMEGCFYFNVFLLTSTNRIPKEDLELQCPAAETTPTLKMERHQSSSLTYFRGGPPMGCFSECSFFLPPAPATPDALGDVHF